MKHKIGYFACLLMVGVLFAACEKMVLDEDTQRADGSEKANVVIRVADIETGWGNASSRTLTDVSEVCSRVAFVVYQNGNKVKHEYQTKDDNGFGSYTVQLEEGTYQLFVLAHSGKSNASISNSGPIATFSNPESNGTGYTDTFYYYGDMTVSGNNAQVNVSMKRATAMFRLKTTDAKPAKVKKLWFRYTGGSGVLDATTGYGTVNSIQVVFVPLDDSLTGETLEVDMYTFLHAETGNVSFSIKAFDASENIISEYTKEFADVPMKRNCITRYTGNFFGNSTPDPGPDEPDNPDNPDNPDDPKEPEPLVIQVDPEWGEIFDYSF